jgi:alkylation response protein AidB-like acyl-CoA dehydrogenase
VRSHFPPEQPYDDSPQSRARWAEALEARGWSAYRWPVEFGGAGWTATQKFLWERETASIGVPAQLGGMGMGMLAPILYTYGSPEQCARHLPGIRSDKVVWCQGYSEPGAGSDLASLRTRAESDGDDYIVNGEKIWTSWAHIADWMFCLVRTSHEARRQDGITFLLIDMRTPGVSVHPIVTIDGRHHLNRVTFENVRVAKANRIGVEGKGWIYAKGLLTHERTGLAYVSESLRLVTVLRRAAGAIAVDGARLTDTPDFASKLAAVEIELCALEHTELRTLSETAAGGAPGAQSSFLKLKGTAVIQAITELFVECAAAYAAPFPHWPEAPGGHFEPIGPDWAQIEVTRYLTGRAASIAGGSDEIQRDIVAKHVLGLR